MAIARGFVTEPVQFNLPVLQMPFEAAYQQMQQMQQSKDQFDELSAMMPKYLNQDADSATKYKGFVDSSVEAVSDAFARGDTSGAMRMLNTAKRELLKEWRPGGIADALQNRYTQAAEANKAIDEHTADFTQPGYQEYFQSQLQQQIGKGIGYDPTSGRYNQISTPDMFGEIVVPEKVDEHLEGWKSDQGYNITKSSDGMWYYKETNERVSERELQQALQSFYQRPDINRALQVQSWYQTQQIPADQRPMYEAQLKNQMRSTFVEQLTSQEAQINDLESLMNSGKHTKELQQELRSLGYDVPVNGILDDETRAAAQGHIQQSRADLAAATSNAEQVISNTSLQDLMLQKQRADLTDAYVPKYAFTKKDVQMIANTPAIAMMKIRAQKQMMDSFTGKFMRPTDTLVAPIKAEVNQVAAIPVQYNNAKQNYNELEATMVDNLPAPFQKVIKGSSVIPVGQGANAMADYLRNNPSGPSVKRTNAVTQALQVAVSNNGDEFNPVAYRQALDYQGIKLTDNEFREHVDLFQNRDNRLTMQRVNDQLLPAYAAVETTGDMYRAFSTAVQNSSDVDWDEIAKMAPTTTAGPVSGTTYLGAAAGVVNKTISRFTGGSVGQIEYDPVETKRKFLQGDPQTVKAVTEWARENNSGLISNLEGVGNVDVLINKDLDGFLDSYKRYYDSNPLALFNEDNLDKSTMEALGFTRNGERVEILPKITSIEFAKRNVNGKSVLVGAIQTEKTSSPVILNSDQINAEFMQGYARNGAAVTMNPDNPGEVRNPGLFNMYSSAYYDLENQGGTGYNANTITRMREQRQYGRVGIEVSNILGEEFVVQTMILPNKTGTQDYLLSITDPGVAAQIMGKEIRFPNNVVIPTGGYVTPELQSFLDKNDVGYNIVPLQQGYEGVKNAIDESKATLTAPLLKRDILEHPERYYKSTVNLTQDAANIGAALMDMDF